MAEASTKGEWQTLRPKYVQDVTFMQILFACTYFYLKLQIVNNIFFFYVFSNSNNFI